MKKTIRRQGTICYHDGFPLYVEQEGFIIPLSLVVHVRGKQESFTNTLNYFSLTAFSLGPNPIRGKEGNSVHREGVDISKSSRSINLRIPKVAKGGGEILEPGAIEDWPAPLGCFRLALVSQAGVITVVVTGVI